MSAQIIDLAARRAEREQAAKPAEKPIPQRLIEAGLMLNPFALMWLEGLEYAAKYASAPTVIIHSEED